MFKRKTLKRYFPLLFTVVLFGLIYLVSNNLPEATIRQIINDAGAFGPVLLTFFFLLAAVIAPLSSAPFYFVGFYAYQEKVVLYFSIAALFSIVINFGIARRWGRPWVEKLVGKEEMKRVDQFTQNFGWQTLLALRLFLGGLNDFISYAAGLTTIKFPPYLLVSIFSSIPGTLLWYYLALKIESPLGFTLLTWLLIWLFYAAFLLGSFVLKKKKKSK